MSSSTTIAPSSSLWVGIAPKVPSRKALNEIRSQWRTGRPGKITDTSTLEKKAWKKQLQSTTTMAPATTTMAPATTREKETEDEDVDLFQSNLIGKRFKDFHPSLPLLIDGEWSGHTFASFSHRFYLTTHMSQTTSKAISQKNKD